MKRFLSLLLPFAIVVSLIPTVLAADDTSVQAAQSLYEMGLFQGTGMNADGTPDFGLDRAPTRTEAVTMLVRLLGKEAEAKAGTWTTPFTDVDEWAKPYVGYAYTNGLTTGTSGTLFGGAGTVDAAQYFTLVLRALGYTSGTDFQWDQPWELSKQIGLTDGRYNGYTGPFNRSDVAVISLCALKVPPKGSSVSLMSALLAAGANIKSTNEQKVDILASYAAGLTARLTGLEQTRQVLELLSSGDYSASYGLVVYKAALQKEQELLITAIDQWNHAIDLCGNYSDTQTMKTYLKELVDLYTPMTSYVITIDNAIAFNESLLNTDTQRSANDEKITAEKNRWVAEKPKGGKVINPELGL